MRALLPSVTDHVWRARTGAVLPVAVAVGLGLGLGLYAIAIADLPTQSLGLLVMAAMVPCVLAIVGRHLRRLLLAVALLDIPLQIDTHLGFQKELERYGALGGWNVSLTTVALLGLYALWTLQSLSRTGPSYRVAVRASLPVAGYVAVTAVSMLVAQDAVIASFQVTLLAQMLLLYVYLTSTIRTRDDLVFAVTMLAVGLALEGVLILLLWGGGETIRIPGLTGRVDLDQSANGQTFRAGGTLGSANTAAAYLSLALGPVVGLLVTSLGRWHKRLALVASLLGVCSLVLTLSRGGWFAFLIAMAIFCLLTIRRGWLSPIMPAVLVGVAVVIVIALQDLILIRLTSDDQNSAHSRIPLMMLAFRIIADHPFVGIGANNYVVAMTAYATPDFAEIGGEWLYIVHNMYLLIWAETGLLGLGAYLWLLAATLRAGWRGWQRDDRLVAPIALGITSAIVGHVVHMLVDLFTGRPQAQTLWVLAALLGAIAGLERPAPSVAKQTAPARAPGEIGLARWA